MGTDWSRPVGFCVVLVAWALGLLLHRLVPLLPLNIFFRKGRQEDFRIYFTAFKHLLMKKIVYTFFLSETKAPSYGYIDFFAG
jgi:hypothetical protein